MHASWIRQRIKALLGALLVLSLLIVPAAIPTTATHSIDEGHQWGSYKWARNSSTGTSGPLALTVVDNTVTSSTVASKYGDWSGVVAQAVKDWNEPYRVTNDQKALWDQGVRLRGWSNTAPPPVWNQAEKGPVKLTIPSAKGTSDRKTCKPKPGVILVCNYTYGQKGWSGLAQIWLSNGYISQATAKLNDTYFTEAYYQNAAYYAGFANPTEAVKADRLLVACQEIAHGFAADHDDEAFGNTNTGTCMDYGNSPKYDEHPRFADYATLKRMYCASGCGDAPAPPTSVDTVAAGSEVENDPRYWGEVVHYDSKGRPSHYRKNLGNGQSVETFVIYARGVSADEVGPGQSDAGHSHGGSVDDGTGGGMQDGGQADRGKNDGGRKADSKRDGGKKADSKRDGGKKSQKRQGQHGGHNRNH
jgi:hypothetical protein